MEDIADLMTVIAALFATFAVLAVSIALFYLGRKFLGNTVNVGHGITEPESRYSSHQGRDADDLY